MIYIKNQNFNHTLIYLRNWSYEVGWYFQASALFQRPDRLPAWALPFHESHLTCLDQIWFQCTWPNGTMNNREISHIIHADDPSYSKKIKYYHVQYIRIFIFFDTHFFSKQLTIFHQTSLTVTLDAKHHFIIYTDNQFIEILFLWRGIKVSGLHYESLDDELTQIPLQGHGWGLQ